MKRTVVYGPTRGQVRYVIECRRESKFRSRWIPLVGPYVSFLAACEDLERDRLPGYEYRIVEES